MGQARLVASQRGRNKNTLQSRRVTRFTKAKQEISDIQHVLRVDNTAAGRVVLLENNITLIPGLCRAARAELHTPDNIAM